MTDECFICEGEDTREDRIQMALKRTTEIISQFGWMIQGVLANPPFSYSIGIHRLPGVNVALPEIMMVGFDNRLAGTLINDVGNMMREGSRFEEWGRYETIIKNFPVIFREIAPASIEENCGWLSNFCDTTPRMLQMFLPDKRGSFPWDESCDHELAARQYSLNMTYRR